MRDYYEIEHYEEQKITDLLMFHKIVEVVGDTLVLDNGVELEIVGNMGCGGCASGNYDVTELNECDNVITNVEFVCEEDDEDDKWCYSDKSYQIFVYAENTRIKIVQVDGTDGNGYYGTGYSIRVRNKE